jgi:hypothetical protein
MMGEITEVGTVSQIWDTISLCTKFMARDGDTDKRILSKMWKTDAWDVLNDVITFVLTMDIASKKNKVKGINNFITRQNLDKLKNVTITKRFVLSVISSCFDPIGLLSSNTVKYKIKLSEIIKYMSLKWDDDLGQELSNLWRVLLAEIVNLPDFTFNRATKPANGVDGAEMIIFWDREQI